MVGKIDESERAHTVKLISKYPGNLRLKSLKSLVSPPLVSFHTAWLAGYTPRCHYN
jgi:hypothetical protein